MVSKTLTLVLAVAGIAIAGFLIWWFTKNSGSQQTSTQSRSSPLTTVEHDVSNFVNDVKNGFSNVLSAGGSVAGKFLGWGEKELSNTAGLVENGLTTVERDATNFVEKLYNTIGLGAMEKGLPKLGGEIVSGVETVGKDIVSGIEQVGKYKLPPITIGPIGKDIEKGVNSFVNDVKSLFSKL